VAEAPAAPICARYADRWTSDTAFPHLPVALAGEVDTLGYPTAALCGVCGALGADNVVARVNGAWPAAQGTEDVKDQLSL
jgi:hypothetical protein